MSQPRPLMAAVAAQQRQIHALAKDNAVLRLQLQYVAHLAGVSKQVQAIRVKADIENPAQPVQNPPSEQPFETTEQAVQPETYDDVRNPGITPGSVGHVPAEVTTVALEPGETLPTTPFNQLDNVQAPIAGTETQLPLNQTRIETDVRVGDPMNPEIAYPWDISPNQSNGGGPQQRAASKSNGNRTIASIQLARLQIQAGLSDETNDLFLGAKIESSDVSDAEIASTITTLAGVRRVAARQSQRPAGLVPRSASVRRTTPSLASGETLVSQANLVSEDVQDSDLFD
jgi:hypothetical protein